VTDRVPDAESEGARAVSSLVVVGTHPGRGVDAFWLGDFAALDLILEESNAKLGQEPWDEGMRSRFVYQRGLGGSLMALRGDGDGAEAAFEEAIASDGGSEVQEARVMAMVLRALFASDDRPERALEDVSAVRRLADVLGPVAGVAICGVAEGQALARLGQSEESIAILGSLRTSLSTDMGRSLAALRLAEVLLHVGDRRSARTAVDSAREAYLEAGARYWCARAALLTGSIERDRSGRWLRMARELSLDDPAYEQLFLPKGSLRIDPGRSPAVTRDGVPVRFLTRHAEVTLRMLAASGAVGLPAQEIIELFWHDVPAERQRARLRTLLWQVRNSLGADAWRVQRRRDFVVFDADGVELEGTVKTANIAAEFQSRWTARS